MAGMPEMLLHLLWIAPLVLLVFYLSSPRFRGDIAETRVRRLLRAGLDRNLYTILDDLTVPSGGGTTHIDHVVVSRFGIFVIESQYATGMVAGTEVQDRWKQRRFGRDRRFDNPVHRNRLQVEALQRLLGLPASRFHRVVAFTGQQGFKDPMPPSVVYAEKVVAYVRRCTVHLLSAEQADQALRILQDTVLRSRPGPLPGRRLLLQSVLSALTLGGAWLAFRDDIGDLRRQWQQRSEMAASPEAFRADGTRKSETELWEDSLICAWSVDTGRCACYEPSGAPAEIGLERCRELAERGSILQQ